jgi:hypothetical protein
VVVVVVVVAVAYVKPHVLNGILRRFIVVDVDALHTLSQTPLFTVVFIFISITYIYLFFMVKFNFII